MTTAISRRKFRFLHRRAPLRNMRGMHGISRRAVQSQQWDWTAHKVSALAVAYLVNLNPRSMAGLDARQDALEHLVNICMTATQGRFVPGCGGADAFQERKSFCKAWLLNRLHQYANLTNSEIEAAAKRQAFRYLGRECLCDLIDEIRKHQTQAKAQRAARSGYTPKPVSVAHADLMRFLAENGTALKQELGWQRYTALQALVSAHTQIVNAAQPSDDGTEPGIDRAAAKAIIAAKFDVGEPRALQILNAIRDVCGDAPGGYAIREFYDLLAPSRYRHTAKAVRPNGHDPD